MNNPIAVREQSVIDALELPNVKQQLQSLLANDPKKLEAFKTRILKISLNAGLKQCTPVSIIQCGLQAETLGLPLEAGQGYIVAYKNVAQVDVGYKGWQVLAKRAGFSVVADVVYKCDLFEQEGHGFDKRTVLLIDHDSRKIADDSWCAHNLRGVIVQVREDSNGNITEAFVPADMIKKIVGVSPSAKSSHSPHNNWTHQMFAAKAIKQVLTKFPIDISAASKPLHDAVAIVNGTESSAQQAAAEQAKEYSQERFDQVFPQWQERVSSGRNKAMAIITQISNSFKLSEHQLASLMTLKDLEPIDVVAEPEVQDAE